jgi:hypothetical protein
MIDFLRLECYFGLGLVQISQGGERRGEMLVFLAQSVPYSHTAELVVRSVPVKCARAQLLNPCHGLLASSIQSLEGLLRTLSDGETVEHGDCSFHVSCMSATLWHIVVMYGCY